MYPSDAPAPDPDSNQLADPFLMDQERLESLAPAELVRAGLRHFKDTRVVAVDRQRNCLWATVEDEDTEEQVSLELTIDDEGRLATHCACPAEPGLPCVHALAALFAYVNGAADRGAGVRELLGAAEGAIDERVKRGRTEVLVQQISGDLAFGAWSARSITSSTHVPVGYRVHIRSLTRRANYCTCPDFASNQLGTCKHIEAVLHRIGKRRDFRRLKEQPPPAPFVWLDWESDPAPRIRLHRAAILDTELARLLDEHFDASGAFCRRLPEDFLRLAELVADRADIDLGADALDYARRLAEQAAQGERARTLGEAIRAGGGRLPGVTARLYPYQVDGVAFLVARGRALLADDMGLGKTLQAIAAAAWLRQRAEVERILVICPASLKQQWAREIQRFTGQETRVVGGPAAGRAVQYREGRGFFILNYELVLRDVSVINETLRPDLVILDEAQRIKNWRTKLAAAVKRIPSRYAFVLTGTPLENRLEDLYSLMQVVDHRVLGPLWRYLVDFHITDERGKILGYRNLSELRRRLAPVMLRRDRQLVRDQLPERIESRLDIPLDAAQVELHGAALQRAGILAQIAKRRPLTPAETKRLLSALQEARMACDAAGLVDKETEGSPKLDELVNLLDDLCLQSGQKAVIFSQWEQMTRMVEQRVRAMGLGCVRLHGGVPTDKRGALIDRFRDDPATQVFISTDAGGVGLNLQAASVLINLDIPWNPAVLDQRIGRIHRLGQTARVQILLLVAADSYEGRVLELVGGKRHLFDNVVDPNATEDVAGVSRKLLEILAQDLAGSPGLVGGKAETEAGATDAVGTEPLAAAGEGLDTDALAPEPIPDTDATPRAVPEPLAEPIPNEAEQEIRDAILAVQSAFGARIERILGAGGGLLVVLDQVDDLADRAAAAIPGRIPVALIDRRTLGSLSRLGAASPVAGASTLFDAEQATPGAVQVPAEPRLLRQAREKLRGAEVLIGQACPGAAMDLLVGALLAAAALRAGQEVSPTPAQAGVWVFAEALPRGVLTQDEAALLMRALALGQGADGVPDGLLRALAAESADFVEGCRPS
ncbi:DEAD/DEAH box helicase [uncultured Thiodictyon sp.]|uniref:SNF2-related protein n=1 Tax=uncultured Thiodictyon sp. TaxID=1846217 RepID=UPI0025E400F0|nr:DEAD/DEAH box helicase [uncultured Thiodictyon sp.]